MDMVGIVFCFLKMVHTTCTHKQQSAVWPSDESSSCRNWCVKFLSGGADSLYASLKHPFYTAQAYPEQSPSCRVLVTNLEALLTLRLH